MKITKLLKNKLLGQVLPKSEWSVWTYLYQRRKKLASLMVQAHSISTYDKIYQRLLVLMQ